MRNQPGGSALQGPHDHPCAAWRAAFGIAATEVHPRHGKARKSPVRIPGTAGLLQLRVYAPEIPPHSQVKPRDARWSWKVLVEWKRLFVTVSYGGWSSSTKVLNGHQKPRSGPVRSAPESTTSAHNVPPKSALSSNAQCPDLNSCTLLVYVQSKCKAQCAQRSCRTTIN